MAETDSVPIASVPAARRGLSLTAIIILLVVGALGGGYLVLSWPQIFARISASMPFRITSNTAPAPIVVTPALEQRLASIEKQLAREGDAAEKLNAARYMVQDLDARVAKLEAQNAALVMRNAAATIALSEVIRLSDSGRPFAGQLDLLKGLLPDAPEIKQLAPYAATGVPTEAVLAEQFNAAADAAMAADREASANGWFARQWQRLTGLVAVRRIGNASGNDTESRLARAGNLVAAHDLAGAMTEMRALPPEARKAAGDWMRQAEARLAVSGKASAIAARLARQLGSQAQDVAAPSP